MAILTFLGDLGGLWSNSISFQISHQPGSSFKYHWSIVKAKQW